MAEKPFTGLTAKVQIGESTNKKTIAYISGCDLTLEKDIIEILQFGASFKEKVPAIKDWSLSMDGTVAWLRIALRKHCTTLSSLAMLSLSACSWTTPRTLRVLVM